MAEVPSAAHVARVLADAMKASGIPYAIGGAIAYGLWAPPRATNDVDLTLFVELDNLGPAFETQDARVLEWDRIIRSYGAPCYPKAKSRLPL